MRKDMQVEKYALEKAIAEAIDEEFIHRSADFVTTEDFENKLENALQTIIGKLTLRFGIGICCHGSHGDGCLVFCHGEN
jgi:hypothetical protein